MAAKVKSFIKIDGTLDGLTFYEAQGQRLVKTASGVSKDRILNDPDYKRTRENMAEFGGSAKVAKAFRLGFANVIRLMSDRYLTGRLTGMFKTINTLGTGARGERTIDITLHKEVIEGMEFNEASPFGAVFFAPSTISANANRDVITWNIPDFDTGSYVVPPSGATHFRLVLVASTLSDYAYTNPSVGYEPVNLAENTKNALAFSAYIPLGGMVGSATSLVADIGIGAALPATVATMVGVGVVFYQDVNGSFYDLASDNAMQIAAVV